MKPTALQALLRRLTPEDMRARYLSACAGRKARIAGMRASLGPA